MNKLKLALFTSLILLAACLVYSGSVYSGSFSSNAPRIQIKDGTSSNWSGYAIETNLTHPQNGAVTDVKGSWVVPAVDASQTPNAYSSFWIGIDGYSSGTVEQIGTDSDASSGSLQYYAWYEMYPKYPVNLKMKISPGDKMSAEVKYLGKGNFQLTITDITTGATFSTTQKSPSAKMSSAEWIAEAPWSGGVLPLADFGTVSFTNAQATLNGVTSSINYSGWQYDAITMTTSSGTVKAQPSSLSSGGSSFSIAWYHS
jgi:hypothetical protein